MVKIIQIINNNFLFKFFKMFILIFLGKYLKRLEKILFGALNYLYFNNVTVQEFFKKNPFPKKPFNLKCNILKILIC